MRLLLPVAAVAALLAGCGGSGKPRPDLVFVSTRSGVYDLYEMNANGGDQRRLTHGKTGNPENPTGLFYALDPAWSHDGRTIAFSSRRNGVSQIFTMTADGTDVVQLTSGTVDDAQPAWSPDGKQLAFVRGGHLEVMAASAGATARRVVTAAGIDADPAWSPAGNWIAYVVHPSGTETREIWLVHPDGSGNHELTKLGASSNSPAWSPDASEIAFSSDVPGTFAIYAIGENGKGERVVSRTTVDAITPAWSPDGRTIAFSRDGSIVIVAAAGGVGNAVTSSKNNDSSPVWNPVPATSK